MAGTDELERVALSLLTRREHSVRELAGKLTARGYVEGDVRDVLAALAAKNLLSDERFADAYVVSRTQRGYGPLRIRAELREKGVADGVIASYLDVSDRDWAERAAAVRAKRFGAVPPAAAAARSKQMRFLHYRGFAPEHIRAAFKASED